MIHRRLQVLSLAVEVRTPAPEVAAAVEFLAQTARQPAAPTQELVFDVTPAGAVYVVAVGDAVIDRSPSPEAVLEVLFAHVQSAVVEMHADHVLVRGAVLRHGSSRALLVGETGCGLTSLAVRLLTTGARFEGDAFALLGADGLTPLPRRLALRPDSRELLAELADGFDDLPCVIGDGGGMRALDPARAGYDWEIRRGPIDACVAVQANFGGQSRLVAIGETEMVRRIVTRSTPPVSGGHGWLRHVVALVRGTACWELQNGRLDDAAALLRDAWE